MVEIHMRFFFILNAGRPSSQNVGWESAHPRGRWWNFVSGQDGINFFLFWKEQISELAQGKTRPLSDQLMIKSQKKPSETKNMSIDCNVFSPALKHLACPLFNGLYCHSLVHWWIEQQITRPLMSLLRWALSDSQAEGIHIDPHHAIQRQMSIWH